MRKSLEAMSIIDLLATTREDDRDIEWLKRALQWAVELEFATIPAYLCGAWSVIDSSDPVRGQLTDIVLQEMLHMGLACNMLTTLGGVPNIRGRIPSYPSALPGGVRPELRVWLAGLSRAMVRGVYMEIEYPEGGPIAKFLDQTYPTIGGFYDAILAAFCRLSPSDFKKERQREHLFGLHRVDSIDDARMAIKTIKEQGEGTSQNPFPGEDLEDRAHYYRFAELYYGKKLVKKNGGWSYDGMEIPLPPAFPMAEVPEAGYGTKTTAFNRAYTNVVQLLQSAWESESGQKALNDAVLAMPGLGNLARQLMQMNREDGSGTYGPDFRMV
jgi:hypothetical protein